MAHSLSAKKRVRQNARRRTANRARRRQIKTLVKRLDTTMTEGNVKSAEEQFRLVAKRLDQVASASTMHKKTAARKKSRLAKRLNALKARPGASA